MRQRRSQFQLALFGGAFVLVLVGALWLAHALKRRPAENPQPDTPAAQAVSEYQPLIQKLSSASETERKSAEKELANAGILAEAELKAAEATAIGQAKDAIQRLRNRSRFMGQKNLDFSKALPANAVVAVNVRNVQETLDKAKTTALGKLLERPAFDLFRADLDRRLQRENTGGLPVEYFKGQIAFAAYPAAPGRLDKVGKFGVLLELRGADPQGEYLEWSRLLLKMGGSIANYKDIECIESGPGQGSYARTGSNVVLGSDPQALHILIDTILNGPAIGANEDVQKIRAALAKEPDLLALIDIPSVFHQVLLYSELADKSTENAVVSLLSTKFGYAGLSSRCVNDGFEDRLTWLMPEGPISIATALTPPANAPTPLEFFDAIPSHAVAAAIGYLDGAKLERALLYFYTELKKQPGIPSTPNPFDVLRTVEQQLSLKPGELLAHIKGEAGAWLLPKVGADWNHPDICGVISAPDEARAEAMAALLDRINSGQPAGAFSKTPYNKRTIRSVNTPSAANPGVMLNYSVDARRLYLATSPQALKKQLDHLDRHTASLLRREPLQKALSEFSAEERRGSAIYLDSQAILTQLAENLLPAAQTDPATPREMKDALAKLPPPVDLFRDFPPLLALTATPKDRAEFVIHGPAPLFPIAAAAIVLSGPQSKTDAAK